ncbi:MAG: hypothetical protein ACXVDD_13520 [Polyangia bacterium]
MRIVVCRAIALSILAFFVGACTRATAIGTPCLADKDCNVKGQRCVAGVNGGAKICTHACSGQTGEQGCPIGYDCTASDATAPTVLTCNKEPYAFDATSGAPLLFGKDCSLQGGTTQGEWDAACAATGDPAPSPTCHHAADPDSRATPKAPLRNDAHAYCTGGCNSDADCPVDMRCGADYDGNTKCLRRAFCDPCVMNDNCTGDNDACVPTSDGSSRYCTKSCASPYDCGGVQGHFLSCAATTDSLGTSAMFCLHKFGACVGTGQVCDPCRVEGDCANGTHCVGNLATGERMCTKSCVMDSECASNKPTGCDYGPPPVNAGDPIYTDLCTGDPNHYNPGVLTCFF